jgi:ATP-dependent DNA helicase RecG
MTQQLTRTALSTFLLRRLGRYWDSTPVPEVSADDLDPTALKRFRKLTKSGGRLPADAFLMNDKERIERLHLTAARPLKRAALL